MVLNKSQMYYILKGGNYINNTITVHQSTESLQGASSIHPDSPRQQSTPYQADSPIQSATYSHLYYHHAHPAFTPRNPISQGTRV